MDGSRGGGRRVEKRGYEGRVEDEEDNDGMPQSKKPKIPGLASVIVEALKVDSLQRLCSSLEPLFRRIVSEEVERALTRFGHGQIAGRMRMPPHLFTGGKVEGEQGAAIHVVLLDATTGNVVQTGPESSSKLNVVVLEGDFNEELDENWSADHFESHEVKAREGKRPLLTGELQVTLNEGVGTLGDLSFTDNSSWIRSRKFRLGLKVASGFCVGIRILWRLDRIAKDGALHKKLMKSEVITVEDFLRVLVKDPQKLRNILGSGMSNRMWENTVEHAKTCVLGGKLYVYYADLAHTTGAIFNHIYELRGLIADGQFVPLESLNHDQKISVDSLVKRAYENWNRVVEYDGKVLTALTVPAPPAQNLIEYPFISSDPMVGVSSHTHHQSVPSDYRPAGPSTFDVSGDWSSPSPHGYGDSFSEEVRLRSSEMLETDDMQKLLRSFGVGETGPTFGLYENGSYGYNIPHEPHISPVYAHGHRRGSGKAVVGWLKLKAALRWGIFIRKKAAERRAQLIELD
ncbi:Calmodulin binding protein-like protein [Cynara cardunculus var. scolymus]|uniref:Calmodulin binding protein-like protein n=1 Tax=Cynara cardunculus var. scolymus TaxID=59895 RepID=A0A118JV92_CYNCS|nr:Calmodulin binding protein-like protein [Cynara cardunculus var. scolymus]